MNNSKKQTSLKKVETNIKNSRKSTGPKTRKGKSISKKNALKHGILSREIVLSDGDGKEKQAEYYRGNRSNNIFAFSGHLILKIRKIRCITFPDTGEHLSEEREW